jgi:hypothetical protein
MTNVREFGAWVPRVRWRFLFTVAAWTFIGLFYVALLQHGSAIDARVFYEVWSTPEAIYEQDWHAGRFIFSPAVAQAIYPMTLLPFPAFYALLTAASIAGLIWCAGPRLAALLLLLPPVGMDLQIGNINILIGAAIVAGLRHPATWALVLLTKVTPGVGVLWFAFRRDWRGLSIALGATAAAVALSVMVSPDLWIAWGERLAADAGLGPNPTAIVLLDAPLTIRLLIATALVGLAAWRGWPWLVLLAGLLAQPAVTLQRASMLAGLPRLIRREVRAAWPSGRIDPSSS